MPLFFVFKRDFHYDREDNTPSWRDKTHNNQPHGIFLAVALRWIVGMIMTAVVVLFWFVEMAFWRHRNDRECHCHGREAPEGVLSTRAPSCARLNIPTGYCSTVLVRRTVHTPRSQKLLTLKSILKLILNPTYVYANYIL